MLLVVRPAFAELLKGAGLCWGNQLKYRFISCPLCLAASSRDAILLSVYLQFPLTCDVSQKAAVTSA